MDKDLRCRMKERGYQQAGRFSWETSVRRILGAYSRIVQGGKPHTGQQPAAD